MHFPPLEETKLPAWVSLMVNVMATLFLPSDSSCGFFLLLPCETYAAACRSELRFLSEKPLCIREPTVKLLRGRTLIDALTNTHSDNEFLLTQRHCFPLPRVKYKPERLYFQVWWKFQRYKLKPKSCCLRVIALNRINRISSWKGQTALDRPGSRYTEKQCPLSR